ncbi:uncharacterized protein [Halyomorpha halys]|uniref:uncharacterized protein n=1 Tax=Halyomorpha halys TaxID=286706 RepID=UPI0006D52457|nr:uncharacterized protein LOC106691651 [Halyomorpha halys]
MKPEFRESKPKSHQEKTKKISRHLSGSHELVRRLIYEEHTKIGQVGVQIPLCKLRERFWILKGRRTVKTVIATCIRCKRFQGSAIKTKPAILPEERVREALLFEVVGVDLAGPLILHDGEKSWIVLYTCAVYRAVHMELVTSLSTNEFLQILRRFIARRGQPKTIFSDNGTNFVGAENLFCNIDWQKIEYEASTRIIQWKFNPPTAAWWSGWWERLIQIVKRMLRRVLGHASLKYEELNTLICDCEAIINHRPLTFISEDTDDLDPLTPAIFLQDSLHWSTGFGSFRQG